MIEFDVTWREEKVKILGVDYLLRELSEEASIKFQIASIRCSKVSADGEVTVGDLAEAPRLSSLLVSLCLTDSAGTPVSEEQVARFPARVIKALAAKVREMSDMLPSKDKKEGKEGPIPANPTSPGTELPVTSESPSAG